MIEIAAPVVAEPPAEPTTRMKPSQALRLGRLIQPLRCTGRLFGPEGAVCSLGAMLLAQGYTSEPDGNWPILKGLYPELLQPHSCPACAARELAYTRVDRAQAYSVVYHLNDEHHWPEARIANWLEKIGM